MPFFTFTASPGNRQSRVGLGSVSITWQGVPPQVYQLRVLGGAGGWQGAGEFYAHSGWRGAQALSPHVVGGGNETALRLTASGALARLGPEVPFQRRSEGVSATSLTCRTKSRQPCSAVSGMHVRNAETRVCRLCHWHVTGTYGVRATLLLILSLSLFVCLFLAGTWEPWEPSPWTPQETWLTQPQRGAS